MALSCQHGGHVLAFSRGHLGVSADRVEDVMTVNAQIVDRWNGGVCPFSAGWRKVMMWTFIVTDGLLFAGFLASYGYARLMAERWPAQQEVFSLGYLAVMTFVLISSSATMASAVVAAGAREQKAATRFVLLT